MSVRPTSLVRPVRLVAALVVPLFLLAGCSSDDDASSTTVQEESASTADAAPDEKADNELTILVTNDDGVDAPGIDTLVESLRALPDTKVIVAAPAENQSGSAGKTTPDGVSSSAAATASGYEATAVNGFPADSVNWALDGGIDGTPDLVISGINSGQNIGKLVDISGTVGAARAAAAKGIPALAVSQGLTESPDYPTAAQLVVEWVKAHRAELLAGDMDATVENLNVPTCSVGTVKGVVEVPVDMVADVSFEPVDCSVPGEQPAADVAAFSAGYAPLSVLSVVPGG